MANRNDRPEKPPKKAAPTRATAAASTEADAEAPARDKALFEKIKGAVAKRDVDRNIVLNLPIWGWTGDGKTCGLLTMLHYADARQHALSLMYVSDTDDLDKLESEVDAYKGMNLAALASATKARLSELSEEFIDNRQWPPGTDEPTPYLFGIRSMTTTQGYLLIPDLQGGSFQQVDDVAKTVLGKAHACVVLVQPDKYVSAGTEGKRYRDEVSFRLSKCAEAKIPACVMITKSDLYDEGENSSAADRTQNELTVLLKSHKDFDAEIFRVSVIGASEDEDAAEPQEVGALPAAEKRNPEQLIRAFVWIIGKALARPADEIRALVPDVGLRRAREEAKPAREAIAELRKLGDHSGCPGVAVCALSNDTFLFLAADGKLFQGSPRDGAFDTRVAGGVAEFGTPTNRTAAFNMSGELLLAPNQKTDAIWIGNVGDNLTKTALPMPVTSWAPVSSRMLVATDQSGRLHSFKYDAGAWSQIEFIVDFIGASERMICAFVDRSAEVLALNGAKAEAIHFLAQGKFGERRKAALSAAYDGDRFAVNRLGVLAAVSAAGELIVSNGLKPHNLGPVKKEAQAPFTLAPSARVVARVANDMRLTVALLQADQVKVSDPAYSPLLPKDPESMIWSADASLLVVTFADGTYSSYKPIGLRS